MIMFGSPIQNFGRNRIGEPFPLSQEGTMIMGKSTKTVTTKIGRDASDGRFIPVKEAERRPTTTTVETIKRKP